MSPCCTLHTLQQVSREIEHQLSLSFVGACKACLLLLFFPPFFSFSLTAPGFSFAITQRVHAVWMAVSHLVAAPVEVDTTRLGEGHAHNDGQVPSQETC